MFLGLARRVLDASVCQIRSLEIDQIPFAHARHVRGIHQNSEVWVGSLPRPNEILVRGQVRSPPLTITFDLAAWVFVEVPPLNGVIQNR